MSSIAVRRRCGCARAAARAHVTACEQRAVVRACASHYSSVAATTRTVARTTVAVVFAARFSGGDHANDGGTRIWVHAVEVTCSLVSYFHSQKYSFSLLDLSFRLDPLKMASGMDGADDYLAVNHQSPFWQLIRFWKVGLCRDNR